MADRPRARVAVFLALWMFSAAALAGPFLVYGTLYSDNLLHYSFFYNNLQSLNVHGAPAWWFPNNQMGYPGYFFSIVSIVNCGMPAFALLGAAVWLLGRLGIVVTTYHALYVFYFGALVPLLFLSALWLLARQVFRSPLVVSYVLIVGAFSPGVVTNLSDIGGLEHITYFLYFAAALLRFLRNPAGRRSYFLLLLTLCLLGLSANYLVLVTAAPLALCLAVAVFSYRRFRSAWPRIRRALSPGRWAMLAVLPAVCAAPNLLAFSQRGELVQRDASDLSYSFADLKAGNPWEVLLASSPAVGLEWDQYNRHADGRPNRFVVHGLLDAKDHISYVYLGLLAWPLAMGGLLRGRAPLRLALLLGLALLFTILLLAGYSAVFAAILVLPTPLQGMNHFSDLLYRDGGFLVLLFAAGLGLERLERNRGRALGFLFPVAAVAAIAVTAKLHAFALSTATGLAALLALLMAVVLAWHARAALERHRRLGLRLLIALALVDVSTFAFWYVRLLPLRMGWKVTDAPHADGLGIAQPRPNRTADRLLHLRPMARLRKDGLPVEELPPLAVYGAAHFHDDTPTAEDIARARAAGPARSLALARNPMPRTPLEPVFRSPHAADGADARVETKTFSRIRIRTESGAPALLFVRDAFSPYWRGWVNGAPAPVYRAMGNFKAVPIPSGAAEVELRFSPPGIAATLALAYASLAVAGACAWRAR
jgi:hypothetical protein